MIKDASQKLFGCKSILKLYTLCEKEACSQFEISVIEADILVFLNNNPDFNTAKDIVEMRMLQKGNVSQAVDLLVQKGLLLRTSDTIDRRKVRLFLTANSKVIIDEVNHCREKYLDVLFKDFSSEKKDEFFSMLYKIMSNAEKSLKGEM